MANATCFNLYDLPPVANVCNQVLREVVSFPNASIAHVLMHPGNVSLLHQHRRMTELYFVIEGRGVLYHGYKAMDVNNGAYCIIPKNTPHQLRNISSIDLEHLVIAIPPFDRNDIEAELATGVSPVA